MKYLFMNDDSVKLALQFQCFNKDDNICRNVIQMSCFLFNVFTTAFIKNQTWH